MGIERNDMGGWRLVCDICGTHAGDYQSPSDAVDQAKEFNFRSYRISEDHWEDICSHCQEEGCSL